MVSVLRQRHECIHCSTLYSVVPDIAEEAGQLQVDRPSSGMAVLRTRPGIGIQGVANGSYTCVATNEDVNNNFTVSIQAYG